MSTNNIFQKLAKISQEMETVAKNSEVGFGSSKYKAVNEADILRAVKPLEDKYGVFSYPAEREIIESRTLEKRVEKADSTQITTSLFIRVKTVYRFVNLDNIEEHLDVISYGDGIDSGDKATGKAMTYSDKYALMKAYKITTGDDPVKEEREPITSTVKTAPSKPEDKPIGDKEIGLLRMMMEKDKVSEEVIKTLAAVDDITELAYSQYLALAGGWSTKVVPFARENDKPKAKKGKAKQPTTANSGIPEEDIA